MVANGTNIRALAPSTPPPLNRMVSLDDYRGREQAYVKHTFLERYLEALLHKTASKFSQIVYIDGYAGPWQSANEDYKDTSFGIALNALRQAKASWQATRDVKMFALLVEHEPAAYARLVEVPKRYPEICVKTYAGDFLSVLPQITRDIPVNAFTFTFVDPKGWRIPLNALRPLLVRPHSEITFNFMFDFINRAVSIKDAAIVKALDELMPHGNFRVKLDQAEKAYPGQVTPDDRKSILVDAFGESLLRLGNYKYVAETTVLRPLKDRPLYCLFYATRHPEGIKVFRDCQIKALTEQSKARSSTKIRHAETTTGQREMFESLHDLGPNELAAFLSNERDAAERTLLRLAPQQPKSIPFRELWPQVLARHVVRMPDVNKIAARLRTEKGKHVPQPAYRTQRS